MNYHMLSNIKVPTHFIPQASDEGNGVADPGLDEGSHEGKTLDDFVAHPIAAAAKLSRAHILAIRLYTSAMHERINRPLLEGCCPARPHPYPALVANLSDAWSRLRAGARDKPTLFSKLHALGVPEPDGSKTSLWRVFECSDDISEYKQRGATEPGFCSAFKSRAAAEVTDPTSICGLLFGLCA